MIRRPLSRILALALAAALSLTTARAAVIEGADPTIERIEAYFEALTTLRANFLQVNHDGSISEGTLAIKRPGRMRIDYAPPMQIEIISDGKWITYIDRELGQISQAPLNGTHAEVLVGEDIDLGGTVAVTDIRREAGALSVTLTRKNRPGEGTLTLIFNDHPLELRQWVVVDPQGLTTRVTLLETQYGLDLDPSLFEAPPPFPAGEAR